VVLRESAAAGIEVGSVFDFTTRDGQTLRLRCTGRTDPAPNKRDVEIDFESDRGWANAEYFAPPADEIPDGKYFCIVPQEDLTITSIDPLQGFTATNYDGDTLAAGIPFYLPFRTCTLTGKADVYKATSRVLLERFDAKGS
jgi:hypothetical protein